MRNVSLPGLPVLRGLYPILFLRGDILESDFEFFGARCQTASAIRNHCVLSPLCDLSCICSSAWVYDGPCCADIPGAHSQPMEGSTLRTQQVLPVLKVL